LFNYIDNFPVYPNIYMAGLHVLSLFLKQTTKSDGAHLRDRESTHVVRGLSMNTLNYQKRINPSCVVSSYKCPKRSGQLTGN